MTTTDIRNVRRDLDDLDERSERLRQDIKKRAEATREDVLKRTEATREQLGALAGEVSADVGERAAAAREALVERYHEIEQQVPTEEIATKAQLGAWKAFQAGLGGLLALPALAVRGLASLSKVVDDLSERGADVSERSRELLATVPPSKLQRRRAKRRTIGAVALGFVAGVVAGWVLAGRSQTVVTYEPPLPADHEPTADEATRQNPAAWAPESQAVASQAPSTPEATDPPVDPAAVRSQTTGESADGDDVLDVRSETESPDRRPDA